MAAMKDMRARVLVMITTEKIMMMGSVRCENLHLISSFFVRNRKDGGNGMQQTAVVRTLNYI